LEDKAMKKMIIIVTMVLLTAAVFANGNDDYRGSNKKYASTEAERNEFRKGNMNGRGAGRQGRRNSPNRAQDMQFVGSFKNYLSEEDLKALTAEEIDSLNYMLEEEKLARDVYTVLGEKWNVRVYGNIARSEQQHLDSIHFALEAAGQNPQQLPAGQFSSPDFQALYNELVAEGSKELLAALQVGATIEDLDIADLQEAVEKTENASLVLLYENLMKGSRNHLRSFVRQLDKYGEEYDAKYISAEYLDEITGSRNERGPLTN
jgi:hypothetical protein